MKQMIDPIASASEICKGLQNGVLLTTKYEGKVNTMTIGWGMLGIEWGKPVFIALVRDSRHTMHLLQGNGEFTVNIPVGEFDKQILGFCGTKSGVDVYKIEAMNLTLEEPEAICVPGIRELPLTLECKVLMKQKQALETLPPALLDRWYPAKESGARDLHTAFYGEIVSAYIIE